MIVDPTKHQHPRRYRRAVGLLLGGLAIGLLLTILGLYALTWHLTGNQLWFTSLVLIGPSVVFLSAVVFSTYLEKLEDQTYGAVYGDEQEQGPRPGAHA